MGSFEQEVTMKCGYFQIVVKNNGDDGIHFVFKKSKLGEQEGTPVVRIACHGCPRREPRKRWTASDCSL